jgi:hypothetical protein
MTEHLTYIAAFSRDFPLPLAIALPVIAAIGAVVLFLMRRRK